MAPVTINVYDLAPHNTWTYWCGVGIFHSGVEVYGVEFAYGGHDQDVSGIFATAPRDAPGQVIFRESIDMGETDLSQQEIHQLVQRMGSEYRGNAYHLLQRNCNHFASDLCRQLTGRDAPSWINRLAGIAVALHCLLPTTWVPPLQTPSAVPHDDADVARIAEGKLLLVSGGARSDVYDKGDRLLPVALLQGPAAAAPAGTRV